MYVSLHFCFYVVPTLLAMDETFWKPSGCLYRRKKVLSRFYFFFAIPWVKIDQINERLGFGALLCRLDLISDQRWVWEEWELHRWQLDLGGTGKNGRWTISPPRQCANRAERASRGSKQGWRERANVAIKEQGGQRATEGEATPWSAKPVGH